MLGLDRVYMIIATTWLNQFIQLYTSPIDRNSVNFQALEATTSGLSPASKSCNTTTSYLFLDPKYLGGSSNRFATPSVRPTRRGRPHSSMVLLE